jgi:capsular polysaccharide transport system permease protein
MADQMVLKKRSFLGPFLGLLLIVGVPTAAAIYYYYTIAVDRYVSEFRYSVRGGAIMQNNGDIAGAIGGSAALVFAADSFVLEDYLVSVQAFEDIEKKLPLREMLSRDGGDPVRNYDPDLPAEEILRFWKRGVDVQFDAITGITTARISFYSPEDSRAVAEALVAELQGIVNGLTREARDDMLEYVNSEYALAETELNRARVAIEDFRRENRTFSPDEELTIDSGIISELRGEINAKEVELATTRQQARNSPSISLIQEEIASLNRQLAGVYEARVGSGEGGFATNLSQFEELQSQYQFARDTYIQTLNLRQQAQANATLNQAQLVVFVEPRTPTKSIDPNRPWEVALIMVFAFLVWVIVRVFMASLATG